VANPKKEKPRSRVNLKKREGENREGGATWVYRWGGTWCGGQHAFVHPVEGWKGANGDIFGGMVERGGRSFLIGGGVGGEDVR